MYKKLIINLFVAICICSSAVAQSIVSGEKIFKGKEFSFDVKKLYPELQRTNVKSRALEFKLDMGEDYGLHHLDAPSTSTPWTSTIEIEVIARTASSLPVETYTLSVTLDKDKPEKIVQLFYTEHAYTADWFQIKINNVTNNLGYSPERITVNTIDNVGYDVLTPDGNDLTIDYRFTKSLLSDADLQGNRQVIGAQFNWYIPENTYFDQYILYLLKLEPNLDGTVDVEWDRATKIELDATQLARGWAGTKHLQYAMNLTEGTGYYVWKVQPVGTYHQELDYRSYGTFSNTDGNPSVYTDLYSIQTDPDGRVTNYSITGSADLNLTVAQPTVNSHRFYYTQYEEDLNWIHSRVWTEGTRQAESVTYANGLSQVKQTQAKSNSENQVIGGQTVYDYMGRPSLQTLPAPMNQTTFGYKEDFLLSHKSTGTSDPDREYSARDFDEEGKVYHTGTVTTSPKEPLATNGSPSKYYSEENDLGDYANRVPNAKGIPYSRSVFYKDGRAYKAAGPGETMCLKKDRPESKNPTYFYAKPTEEELIRVFGEEAPQKVDVYKTIVIDPNGVGTVQYTDKGGQTIATCLSYTGQIDELDDIGNEETFRVDNEMPKGNVFDQQNISTMSLPIENAAGQEIDFNYEFSDTDYGLPCSSSSTEPCDYKIEINITHGKDKEEANKNAKFVIIYDKDNISTCTGPKKQLSCMNNVQVFAPDGSLHTSNNFTGFRTGKITLPQGTYFISKTVSINNAPAGGTVSFLDQQIKELKDRAADWTENSHCGCAGITSLPEGSTGPDGVPETCDDLLDHICNRPKPEQLDMLSERLNEAFKIQFDTDKKNSANETYQVVLDATLTTRGDEATSLAYWRSKIEADYVVLLADNAEIDDDIEKCYQVFGAYAESYNTLEYNVASALVDGALPVNPNENDLDALENTHGKTTYDPTYDFEAAYDQIIINKSQVYTQIIKVDYNAATDYIYGQTIANSGVVTDDIASATYSLMIADPNTNYNTNTSSTTPDVTDKDAWVLGLNYHRCAETYFNFDATTGIGTLKLQGISYDEAVKAVKQCVAQNSIDINTESYFNGGVESQVVNAREGAILSMKKHIAKCKAFCEEKRTGAFVFAVDNQIKEYNEANGVYSIHDEANWKTYEELTAEGNNPFGTDSKECLINSLVNNCENKCEQPLQLQFLEEKKQVDPTTQLPIETDEAYVLRLKNSYTNNSSYNEGVFLEQQHMREAMNYAVDVAPVLVDGYTTGASIEQVEQEIIDFIYAELDKGINYRLFDAPTSTCLSGECGARSQNKTLYVKNNGSNLGLNLKVSTTFENMTPQNIDLDKKKYRLKTISIYLDFLTGGTFFNVSLTNHSDMSNAFNLDAAYTDIKSEIFNLYFDKDHVVHLVLPDEENWFGNVNPITSNTRLVKNDGASGWLASILFSKKIALGTVEKAIKVNLKDLLPTVLASQNKKVNVNLQSQETDGNGEVLYLHDTPIIIKPEYSDLTVFAQELANQINSSQHSSVRAINDGDELTIYFNKNSQFSDRTFDQNLYFDSDQTIFTDNTNEIAFAAYGKVDFMKEIKPTNEFYKFPGNFGGSVVNQDCPVGYKELGTNNHSLYNFKHWSIDGINSVQQGETVTIGSTSLVSTGNNTPSAAPACYHLWNKVRQERDEFAIDFEARISSVSQSEFFTLRRELTFAQNSKVFGISHTGESSIALSFHTDAGITVQTFSLLDQSGAPIKLYNFNGEQYINHKWEIVNDNNTLKIYIDDFLVVTVPNLSAKYTVAQWGTYSAGFFPFWNGCDAAGEGIVVTLPGGESCPICVRYKNVEESLNAWPVAEELVTLTCEQEQERDARNRVTQQLNNCLLDKVKELKANYNTCINNFADEMKFSFDVSYHQYTLYYYNRAGALIKTVPPQGVKFLSDANIAWIKDNRKFVQAGENGDLYIPVKDGTPEKVLVPDHKLVTHYEYNSIGQHVATTTPDGGTHRTWYNAHGQPVLSQDAQQQVDKRYAYIKYDKLGRVIESGELWDETEQLTFSSEMANSALETSENIASTYTTNVESWTNINFPEDNLYKKINWNKVYYTTPANVSYLGQSQKHLRNRISYTTRDEDGIDFTKDDKFTTYYSYDPHGNVEWLLNEIPDLGKKSIAYNYDLVSGNVNKVTYQANTQEQFIHTYTYDEDNRIVDTYTSRDGITFTKEANYDYYLHGPLARTEIGDDHIQGCDYTYTIEGYLKAMNQAELDPTKDPGRDGLANNFLKDEFGMELGYYNGDYANNGTYLGKDGAKDPYNQAGLFTAHNSENLYNGNISYWMANTRADQQEIDPTQSHEQIGVHLNLYRYDKLNRIKKSEYKVRKNDAWASFYNFGFSSLYNEKFNYDYNGNINQLRRYGRRTANGSPPEIDNLQYFYRPNSNQLLAVNDKVTTDLGNEDFQSHEIVLTAPEYLPNKKYNTPLSPDHFFNNYVYDKEGNLIEDKAEGLTITWNSLNKIQQITDSDEGETISFSYDGGGNRVTKTVVKGNDYKKTFYVRDASGVVMAVYEKQYVASENKSRLVLIEQGIYGSDRIGQFMPNLVIEEETVAAPTEDLIQDAKVNFLTTHSASYVMKQEGNSVVLDKIKDEVNTGAHTAFVYQNGTPVLAAYEANGVWNFVNGQGQTIQSLTTHPNLNSTSANLIAGPNENEYYLLYSNASFTSPGYHYIKLWYNIENNEVHTLHTGNIQNVRGGLEAVRFIDGSTRLYANGAENHSTLYSITIDEEGVHPAHRVYEDVNRVSQSYYKQIEFSGDYSKILWNGGSAQLLEANIFLETDELFDVKQHDFTHSLYDFKYSSSNQYIYSTGYENGTSKTFRYHIASQNEIDLISGSTPYYLRRLANRDLMVYQPSGKIMRRVVNEEGVSPTVELDVVIPQGFLRRKSPNGTIETTLENNSRSLAYSSRTVGKRYYESKDHLGNVRAVITDARRVTTGGTSQVYFEGMENKSYSTRERSYEGEFSAKLSTVAPYTQDIQVPVSETEQVTVTMRAYWEDPTATGALIVYFYDENGNIANGYHGESISNYTMPTSPDQWVEVTKTLTVPAGGERLFVGSYAFGTSTAPVWFDAQKIEVTRSANQSDIVYKEDMERPWIGGNRVSDEKYSGLYSEVLYSPEQPVGRTLTAPTASNETIEISAYVKLENSSSVAALAYGYDDPAANDANGRAGTISTSSLNLNSTDWQLLTQTITVPTGYDINTIYVSPRSYTGADKVWFDDVQVKRIETTPLYTYETDVASWTDYYAFGSIMPGRNVSGEYRYGFNGMEKDDEVKGNGASYTAEYWQYDPRLARRWNVDPVVVAYESPYAVFRNNPIVLNDPNGDCSDCGTEYVVDKDKAGTSSIIEEDGKKARYVTYVNDKYEGYILAGKIEYTKNYGWVDMRHAFLTTKRQFVGADNLWSQIATEPEKDDEDDKFYLVTYRQDAQVGPEKIGITGEYVVKYGLTLQEKREVALAIFKDVSIKFEAFQGAGILMGNMQSSFEPADLPSNVLGFYHHVMGLTREEIRAAIQPLDPIDALEIYQQNPGTFSDFKYKSATFDPVFFPNKHISNPQVPFMLRSIKDIDIYNSGDNRISPYIDAGWPYHYWILYNDVTFPND